MALTSDSIWTVAVFVGVTLILIIILSVLAGSRPEQWWGVMQQVIAGIAGYLLLSLSAILRV